jgi:SAM-dependent methyltransferase
MTINRKIKRAILKISIIKNFYTSLNNQFVRDDFIITELKKLSQLSLILDAGCGNQPYRKHCSNLIYKAQDFAQYTVDLKKMIGSEGVGGYDGYKYGELDYIGDIWIIKEQNDTFDAILCSEVLEHIPYPIETIKEFSRLLKKNGTLILTAPSNCLRHMDPYFFYTGFSDRWYEKILGENGFNIKTITPVGDYYSWLAVEMIRTAISHSFFAKLLLAPAFLFFYKKKKNFKIRIYSLHGISHCCKQNLN